MSRKSKYTGGFRPRKYESRIPFPYVVFDEKKEVYFRIVSVSFDLAVTPIMKEHFPGDYKGYIASSKCWEEIKHSKKIETR